MLRCEGKALVLSSPGLPDTDIRNTALWEEVTLKLRHAHSVQSWIL